VSLNTYIKILRLLPAVIFSTNRGSSGHENTNCIHSVLYIYIYMYYLTHLLMISLSFVNGIIIIAVNVITK
jgi:hypothetical protein